MLPFNFPIKRVFIDILKCLNIKLCRYGQITCFRSQRTPVRFPATFSANCIVGYLQNKIKLANIFKIVIWQTNFIFQFFFCLLALIAMAFAAPQPQGNHITQAASVTKFLFNIWPFKTMKIYTTACIWKFAKVESKFWLILNKHSKNSNTLVLYFAIVEFSWEVPTC